LLSVDIPREYHRPRNFAVLPKLRGRITLYKIVPDITAD